MAVGRKRHVIMLLRPRTADAAGARAPTAKRYGTDRAASELVTLPHRGPVAMSLGVGAHEVVAGVVVGSFTERPLPLFAACFGHVLRT